MPESGEFCMTDDAPGLPVEGLDRETLIAVLGALA